MPGTRQDRLAGGSGSFWPESHVHFRKARLDLQAVLRDQSMISIRFSHYVVSTIVVATLLACKQTGQAEASRQMARRTAELDSLGMQAGNAGLPPARILFPVGGHDADPPAGARLPSRALRRAQMRRIPSPKPSHQPRLNAAWPRSGNVRANPDQDGGAGVGGTAEGTFAAASPFWDEQGLPPTIFLTGLFSEARPQNPSDADDSSK